MSRLIEIVYDGGPVLDVVYEAQREALEGALGRNFLTLDVRGMNSAGRSQVLRTASKHEVSAVFIRGLRGVAEVTPFFRGVHFFVDHVGPYDFGVRGELLQYGHKLARAFSYSSQGDADLRHAGFGRITNISGPCLPQLRTPGPEGASPVVGVLDLGYGGRKALGQIKRVRDAQGWDFEIVTTLGDPEARRVGSCFEVAEQCNLLACPMEFKDDGTPHQGAILALSMGRALATSQTSALLTLPYTHTSYVKAEKYGLTGFGTSWDLYRRGRARYDEWAEKAKTDHTQVARELLARM